ncbi:MAG: folylpolyglutamate synthase/dihydrofolate synthase family protein [Lachnotalea sp.]
MYRQAREYLNGITKYGSVLGLESITQLLKRVGDPHKELKFVHIAGTNGKGSTLAFISTILKTAGYKTGRYISPSVFSYREKIQVNEEYIQKESLAKLTFVIKDAIELMLASGLAHPTVFEVETVLAFLYFKQEKCDIVVIETGLGGLLDATNVVENTMVAVITPIDRDHMEFLGDSIKEIAWNKAGIIKKDSVVVTANQSTDAMEVIKEQCRQFDNELEVADLSKVTNVLYENLQIHFNYKEFNGIEINLAGSYQIQNAIVAIEAVKALRKYAFSITQEAILEGLRTARWAGRFAKISENPLIILDGAHNEAAAIRLRETIKCYFEDKKLMFVIGVFADKDYEKIAEITTSLAYKILTVTTPDNPRALSGEKLAQTISKYNSNVEYVESIESAVQKCFNEKNEVDAIIVFGSLSYLGAFEKQVMNRKGGN